MTTTEEAYAEVQRITRRRARNFAYGIMVLPRDKRRAIAAVYAFARRVDDTADGDLPSGRKRAELEAIGASLDAPPGDDPALIALADARARFGIPAEPLRALVRGGLQDLETTRYATFDELRGYCELVAGAVGVACLPVYGGGDPAKAETLGVALQLINIIRDVQEDWELGRVYLPAEELAAHGLGDDDLAAGVVTPAWRAFMTEQATRARAHLRVGLDLLDELDSRSALCVGTFAGLYASMLDRIEASGWDVFAGPPHLSAVEKLRIVGSGLRR
ncbi:MAG: phytoene/squalene synthase family protein [Gaiellaceae bacterium]